MPRIVIRGIEIFFLSGGDTKGVTMSAEFDKFWKQAKFYFVDITPPLKACGNCGKDIVSVWKFQGESLLLHADKSMCSRTGGLDE